MKKRFETPTAIFLIITRNYNQKLQVLLQKRQNTGFKDGFWDTAASGHVEKNENVSEAVIREAKEEIGINISKKDLKFAGFYYNNIDFKVYCYIYFHASSYEGFPTIKELEKCSALDWFDINNLPDKIIPDRKTAIENYLSNIYFGEIGWNAKITY